LKISVPRGRSRENGERDSLTDPSNYLLLKGNKAVVEVWGRGGEGGGKDHGVGMNDMLERLRLIKDTKEIMR
jgi:hypothetical protein